MDVSKKDMDILRKLGERLAEIASLPVQKEKKKQWKRMNNLQPGKPMLWITEEPWHEMDFNGELILQCENEFCRLMEDWLRKTLYEWEHTPGDMIIEPVIYSPLAISDPGIGIKEDVDIARTDEKNVIYSRHFHIQIKEEEDLEKIKLTQVSHNKELSEERFQILSEIYEGVIPVEKRGYPGFWFAPWDELVRFWGVQEALMDLIMKPELVHKAMDKMLKAHLHRLDQFEELNLLASNANNSRVGSGAYGYVDGLPPKEYDADHVKTHDMWGGSTAQIFSEVSPEMHDDFALQYEIRWLERFGLNYYGCCEPLHKKMDIVRKIPNLRKVSMSPWVDIDEAAEKVGKDFVFSLKPSPAIFVDDKWDPSHARKELEKTLDKLKNNIVEVVMKDISTVKREPQRLWEWARIAKEVTEKFG